ncbi:hypothetical protein AAFC00_004252 [Neodothiora populina]|uniref:Rad4-domain-containing protein n=1 Tax=Neodothiora populina TaxID=2781224 RepID=A0ABR3PJA3_9PEZI
MVASKGKSKAQIRAEDRLAAIANSSTRSEAAAAARRQNGVPDVFREMLSEAETPPEPHIDAARSAKRRRLDSDEPAPIAAKRQAQESRGKAPSVTGDFSENELESLPQQTVFDSGSDDDDIDWEEIGFDQEQVTESPSVAPKDADNDISDIAVEVGPKTTPKKVAAKRKPVTTAEKLHRLAVHESHLLFLIFHVHVRNAWCNSDEVHSRLRGVLPLKVVGLMHPREDLIQYSRSESFINGLKIAVEIWESRFRVTENGMRRPQWADDPDTIRKQIAAIVDEVPSIDKDTFIKRASTLKGSQDLGNQLFCALLRSVGVEARLVCSLQALPFSTAGVKSGTPLRSKPTTYADGTTSAEEGSAAGSASDTSSTPRGRRRRIGQPMMAMPGGGQPFPNLPAKPKKKPSSIRKLDYPIFWVEAFNPAYQRWVPIDATVTGVINKPSKLEPPASYEQNSMSYVLAFESNGCARDVTRRYAKAFNAKTRKSRIESTENGDKWWRKALKPFRRRKHTDRDQVEDAELATKEAAEGLPNNVQDFKGHPYYALERHLKRHEVIFPKREVGKINTGKSSSSNLESVYRRSDVQLVRSADKWYRVGREIEPGEQALKHVPARRGVRAAQEELDEENPTTALYAYSQTSLYIPPRVVDGRIPKNGFGNLDVYVPSMVPPGAVHIRHALAARAAKVLGIDFADAVTGFTFKGRIGEAVKAGVVVASEYEESMRATIEGFQNAAQAEEDAKRTIESLRLWRRFLTGLRIGARLGMYDNDSAPKPSSRKIETVRKQLDEVEEKQEEAMGAGGFFPDAAEETAPTASRFGGAAQPRSLLARAQEEADAEMYDDEADKHPTYQDDGEDEDEGEQVNEPAPRLRRQRNITLKDESEAEEINNNDSEDDFVPEPIRPPPVRRQQGRAHAPDPKPAKPPRNKPKTKATPTPTPTQATRRSTRVTRSQAKLAEESSAENDEPPAIQDGPDHDTQHESLARDAVIPSAMTSSSPLSDLASDSVDDDSASVGDGGFFHSHDPSSAQATHGSTSNHAAEADTRGGFVVDPTPDVHDDVIDDGGGGFIPNDDGGGGFILENDEENKAGLDEDVKMSGGGGGFIPEDDVDVEDDTGTREDVSMSDSGGGGFIRDAEEEGDGEASRNKKTLETVSSENGGDVPQRHIAAADDNNNNNDDDDDDDDKAGDIDGEGQDKGAESDKGSLLSHDPEDEDAEPEWLNSD